MAHWNHPVEREDSDTHDEDAEAATRARQWLRKQISESILHDSTYGALADLEAAANPYFLGQDYDEDTDDVDEMGPY